MMIMRVDAEMPFVACGLGIMVSRLYRRRRQSQKRDVLMVVSVYDSWICEAIFSAGSLWL